MPLRQGCELWATFDAEDVDANRGIVRDRSGKGRTLQASGGPTYGQNSPVGEAVAGDGTDDRFDLPAFTAIQNRMCVFQIADTDSTNRETVWNQAANFGGTITAVRQSNGATRQILGLNTSDPGFNNTGFSSVEGRRAIFNYRLDEGEVRIYGPDNALTVRTIDTNVNKRGRTVRNIGGDTSQFNAWPTENFDAQLSMVAHWSRTLDQSERDELFRMTDRMVSKL